MPSLGAAAMQTSINIIWIHVQLMPG